MSDLNIILDSLKPGYGLHISPHGDKIQVNINCPVSFDFHIPNDKCGCKHTTGLTIEDALGKMVKLVMGDDRPEMIPLEARDYSKLEKKCDEYINSLIEGVVDRDSDVYIAEVALMALYGEDIFDWINEMLV